MTVYLEQDSPNELEAIWKNLIRRVGHCAEFCDGVWEADVDAEDLNPDRIKGVDE